MTSTITQAPLELELMSLAEPTPSENVNSSNSASEADGIIAQQLLPTDKGLAAWKMLFVAFVFEAVLWGFPMSFGVFQNYYSSLPQFAGDSNIALIGTLAQGLSYLGAPLAAACTKRFPKYQRLQIYLGWPLCIVGLLAGSFADSVGGLIATQGVMYGVGFLTLTYPIISIMNEWWVARKGMAFGLLSASSGVSGAVMPFVIESMLNKYGHKTTLRAVAVAVAILTGPMIPFIKQRLPPAERSAMAKTNWSFFKRPLFWVYGFSTLIQGFGFFFPALYLPSYATSIGLDPTQGALILALMSIAQVFGQLAFGYLSDKRISVSVLSIICLVMSAAATFGLWGPAKSRPLLFVFSVLYGFFGYGFGAMRMAMGKAVSDDSSAAVATYAILVFLQGVGNVLVGPISNGLLQKNVKIYDYGVLRYRSLVILTGACMSASALVIGLWHLRFRSVVEWLRL